MDDNTPDFAELRPEDRTLLQTLHLRLRQNERPGRPAQQTMAPPLRGEYGDPPANARRAAVLALFYPVGDAAHLLYIQRTSPPGDRHAGQISFPGGSVDPEDADTAATARRELEEEVGVRRDQPQLLGALTPLYIPVSNFLVDPYVGYLPKRPVLVPQESEVARILEIPLNNLLQTDVRRIGTRTLSQGLRLPDTPYYAVSSEEIWGATSMMTAELLAMLID